MPTNIPKVYVIMEEKKQGFNQSITGSFTGVIVACAMSYHLNQDAAYAVLHGLFGWGYVIYRLLLPFIK
jgi:hypothetical protein